ncbi:hypothetical protein PPYR_03550 [Photinus pyralis]|uniref:Uncharacterized protein n=2 Tax=Photinus pyralis TaxID=7054 RepID=A0A1Y1K5Z5_PHOPY|nr:endothelin-converting enzyme homolog isoform X1 [Photinus pyralis]XP_031330873.1 endothelin-converting enzyme homolog isoform X1 [Photinus pyralis]KAB0791750.1 hypothetical protein PPYR_03550 [Photinus pyralis]
MSVKMTKYKHAEFADDDTSVGSVQFGEGITSSATHIRYYTSTSMWKKRSLLEKALLILVVTLTFVIMVLAFLLAAADTRIREGTVLNVATNVAHKPCLTKNCIEIASSILQAMDTAADPCEDFYSYSCNGWIKNNPIPEGKSNWGTFMKLEQENQLVVKHVLEKPIENLKSKAEQKAKWYYESCLDVNETIEELDAKPMLNLISKVGGWSVGDANFSIKTWSLQNVLQTIQNKYNIGALFSYIVGEDDRNSSRHVIQIDQSGLTLPTRDNYLNATDHEKLLKAYLDYMTKVGVLLNGNPNDTQAQMQAVIDFETKLANITTPSELRRDEESLYHAMPISELQERAGFIDWKLFFENALKIVGKRKISSKETVVVYAPEYLEKLTTLIEEYQGTEEGKIVLNNYLMWQTVKTFTSFLSKAFRDAYKGLRKVLLGTTEGGEEPQWRYCIADTNNVLGFAIGAIFVREVFQGDSKTQAETMVNNVRTAFKNNFKNLNWMDVETRIAAEKKADAISDMIGYPEFILNPNLLDDRYSILDIRNDEYFENNIKVNLYALRKNLEKINEPVNKTTWSMSPSTVNAYYTPTKNQMVFPAGILQRPFYDSRYPASLNYGGMGVVLGHELTHGFDDQGREYDKNGNMHRWWKNETIERFKERTKCVVDQYDKFKINNKNINGNQTLGENIADNGGLKAAYHAYLIVTDGEAEPPPLPGLNLTHRQLFFIAFAQVWCSSATNESSSLQIEKDAHSPARVRVLGSLANLKEFSDEFKCKSGSKMNPKNKCEVW